MKDITASWRFASLIGGLVAISVASCGGSGTTAASTHASSQGRWQVILTVKTAAINYGIPGIALDGHGNLYVTELDDNLIYEYSTSGKLEAQWGGTGSAPGRLTGPNKLTFDIQGNLYVTEVGTPSEIGSTGGNNRVQKFSPTGTPLHQWGTLGSGPGQFNTPVGIAVDRHGDIFVSDVANHRIQKLSPIGQSLTQWHTVGTGTGEANTEIGYDLVLDAAGNVYLSEPHPFGPGNDRLQKFSPEGQLLATWGGSGIGPGQFNQPTGLAVDGKGNIFVVDAYNNRVQELSPSGQFVAQWDGPGFRFVSKIAVDAQRNMYVTVGNQVFRRAF